LIGNKGISADWRWHYHQELTKLLMEPMFSKSMIKEVVVLLSSADVFLDETD